MEVTNHQRRMAFFFRVTGADFTDETLVVIFYFSNGGCLKERSSFCPGFPLENVGVFFLWDLHRFF